MNFARIADKHPSERAAIARLEQIWAAPLVWGTEYTLNWLCELVRPNNRERFALVLGDLVRFGLFKQVVRIISPTTQGGIGEYASLAEVPQFVHDWRADAEVEVEPSHIRVVYVAQAAGFENGHPRT